jgi:hypothetical protein
VDGTACPPVAAAATKCTAVTRCVASTVGVAADGALEVCTEANGSERAFNLEAQVRQIEVDARLGHQASGFSFQPDRRSLLLKPDA